MKELKISDLQHPYTTNDSILLSAINKLIKQNNKIERWINRQEEPCGDFIPNEMQNGAVNMEYMNIDDIAMVGKKVKGCDNCFYKKTCSQNIEIEAIGLVEINLCSNWKNNKI